MTTLNVHDDGAPPTETADHSKDPIAQILTSLGRPDVAPATGARAADADDQMTPQQLRSFRDAHGGKSPTELARRVSDGVADQEAQMTPQQLRSFRDSHGGFSPIEWDLRGGVR